MPTIVCIKSFDSQTFYLADLFTASSDKGWGMLDVNTGDLVHKYQNAHTAAINRLAVHDFGSGYFTLTGDDEGFVKVPSRMKI